MAQQKRQLQFAGFSPNSPTGTTTLPLNAAATWLAYGFVPDRPGLTLANARAFVSGTAGTFASGADLTCDLYGDANGAPNASVEGPKSCTTTPSGSGWRDWTGFTTALTQGQQYWLVFKNANGVPATNTATFRYGATGAAAAQAVGTQGRYGWIKQHTANSGGAWGTSVTTSAGWRVGYGDGTFDGTPASSVGSSADLVYASRESGVKFTTPPNAVLNVAGLSFYLAPVAGAPAGGVAFRLYSGAGAAPTPLATTATIPAGNVSGSGWYTAYFGAGVAVQPGTVLRATLADATPGGADSSSNAYRLGEVTWDGDANSLALLPFEGTAGKTYGNPDNTSFADTATGLFAFGLLLDTAGEFAAAGGGGGGGVPMSRVRVGM